MTGEGAKAEEARVLAEAEAAFAAGRYREAHGALDHVPTAAAAPFKAWSIRLRAAVRLGAFDAMQAELRLAAKRLPTRSLGLLRDAAARVAASVLIGAGDGAAARILLERLASEHGRSDLLMSRMAEAAASISDYDAAETVAAGIEDARERAYAYRRMRALMWGRGETRRLKDLLARKAAAIGLDDAEALSAVRLAIAFDEDAEAAVGGFAERPSGRSDAAAWIEIGHEWTRRRALRASVEAYARAAAVASPYLDDPRGTDDVAALKGALTFALAAMDLAAADALGERLLELGASETDAAVDTRRLLRPLGALLGDNLRLASARLQDRLATGDIDALTAPLPPGRPDSLVLRFWFGEPLGLRPGTLLDDCFDLRNRVLEDLGDVPFDVEIAPWHAYFLRPAEARAVSLSHHTFAEGMGAPGHSLHLMTGYLPGYLILERGGYSGWSDMATDPPLAAIDAIDDARPEAAFQALRADYIDGNRSKFRQPVVGADAIPEGCIFVALQKPDDSVQDLAHIPMLEMLAATVAWGGRRNVPVVVKRHPFCRSEAVRAALAALPDHARVTRASVHGIFPSARAVVTVNSGVGFEALLHLKPVILAGASDYHAAASTVRSVAELEAALEASADGAEPARIKRFLAYYLEERSYRLEDADVAARMARRVASEMRAAAKAEHAGQGQTG